MTGLVGTKLPKFSVFGDTMNTASRMESTCVPGEGAACSPRLYCAACTAFTHNLYKLSPDYYRFCILNVIFHTCSHLPGRIQISSSTYALLVADSDDASASAAAGHSSTPYPPPPPPLASSSTPDVDSTSADSWQPTGGLEIKGKGVMETYLWLQVCGV